jgi:hypothetical protein
MWKAFWARNTPGGAWQYDLPADANEQNVDWKRFLKDKPQLPYDPKRFFAGVVSKIMAQELAVICLFISFQVYITLLVRWGRQE